MSNYWYLRCLTHDPIIVDGNEFTQHTDDAKYKEAIRLVHARPLTGSDKDTEDDGPWMTNNAKRFLRDHTNCKVDFIDEYNNVAEVPKINKKVYQGTLKEKDMQFSNGALVQMCVLHRVAPEGEDVQSMGVIGGAFGML